MNALGTVVQVSDKIRAERVAKYLQNMSRDYVPVYSDNDTGIFLVEGEDPNCDMFGPHHNPVLGYFSGRFSDVLQLAVRLAGWETWGTGGKITRITVKPVDTTEINKVDDLLRTKVLLEQQLELIKSKLQ